MNTLFGINPTPATSVDPALVQGMEAWIKYKEEEQMYEVLVLIEERNQLIEKISRDCLILGPQLLKAGLICTPEATVQRIRLKVATSLAHHFKMDLKDFKNRTKYDQDLAQAMNNLSLYYSHLNSRTFGVREYGEFSLEELQEGIRENEQIALDLIQKRNAAVKDGVRLVYPYD